MAVAMGLRTVAVLFVAASSVHSVPLALDSLVDELDAGLTLHPEIKTGKQETQASSGLGRYISFSSVGSWLSGIDWRVYGDYTHFLTLPDKGLPVYFNGSSATVTAITANLLAIGLGAYLLSFLPASESHYSKYGDEYYDEGIGNALARDQDIYDFDGQDGDYNYQYPDSGDWDYAASEPELSKVKRRKVKEDRMGSSSRRQEAGDSSSRRPGRRLRRRRQQQQRRSPSMLESFAGTISSLFGTPLVAMARMGEAVVDPGSFLNQFAKRYDSYWQRRRGGRARERAQYRTEEEGEGILLPEGDAAEQVSDENSSGPRWPGRPAKPVGKEGLDSIAYDQQVGYSQNYAK